MQVDRLSITVDPELGKAVRDAAARSSMSVSRWMSEAATARLRNQLLGEALDVWEAEIGPPTEEELNEAAKVMFGGASRRHKVS